MNKVLARALGTLAVAGMLGIPAFAGVTGAEGGTNTTTTTRTEVHTNRVTSTSTTYLDPIIRDLGDRIANYVTQTSTTYVDEYASDWRTQYFLETGSGHLESGGSTTTETGRTSWLSFLRHVEQQIADQYMYDTYTKTGQTLDRTESSKTVNDSADLILIGDTDSASGGYAAQGTRTSDVDIVDYYWDNLHKETTRQKSIDAWDEYQQTTLISYVTTTYWYGVTPIVLNMDGSGKLGASAGRWTGSTKGMYGPLAVFDFYGSGEQVLMEWVKPQDGLLIRLKEHGQVDGTCLFGSANGYQDGFEELATLDRNDDGRLSGKELQGLYVWQDANGNAIAGLSEVKSLEDLGITELSLEHKNFESSFMRNGQRFKMWDWHPLVKKLQRAS